VLPETADDGPATRARSGDGRPGVIIVSRNGAPACEAIPIDPGRRLIIGREEKLFAEDGRLSRRHGEIRHARGTFSIVDFESRNGTFVDGERIDRTREAGAGAIVRVGRTVLALVADLDAVAGGVEIEDGEVIGPERRRLRGPVRAAAEAGDTLLLLGESGCGKESIARSFHAEVGRGPFVAVNCSTIPAGLAERLLLGARRGAFSGATDAEGWFAAAHGGVLFLDEIAELETSVQAKLLRVLETGEVTPLGATRSQSVQVRVVFATHRDLRADVASQRFRADLFYRIDQPSVRIAPLRERKVEIPWLIELARADRRGPIPHPAFVETCLSRPWPGNVRELLRNVRQAATRASLAGADEMLVEHLDAAAGTALTPDEPDDAPKAALSADDLRAALKAHGGNISATARALGLHRNQLRRLLDRYEIGD
jgi:DNA-binding NtrC family response regulator